MNLTLSLFTKTFNRPVASFRKSCKYCRVVQSRQLAYGAPSKRTAAADYDVFCGDCTTESAYKFLRLGINPGYELADILITDPPYCLLERRGKSGMLRDPKVDRKRIDGNDAVPRFESVREYKLFTQLWLTRCIQQGLKKGAVLVIWTNALGKIPIIDVCKLHNYALRGEYIWAKPSTGNKPAVNSSKNEALLRIYETALVFELKSAETTPMNLCNDKIPW